MSVLLTRCPHCTTVFRLTPRQLAAAHGRVRCGACRNVFHALEDLLDEVPAQAAAAAADDVPRSEATPDAPVAVTPPPPRVGPEANSLFAPDRASAGAIDLERSRDESSDLFAPDRASAGAIDLERSRGERRDVFASAVAHPEAAPPVRRDTLEDLTVDDSAPVRRLPRIDLDAVLLDVSDEPQPEHSSARRSTAARVAWTAAVALLGALLFLQAIWFRHEAITAAVPAVAPIVADVCAFLACPSAVARDSNAIRVVARDVRQHPRYRNALLVNATIVNEAGFRQPFPTLQLGLFDVDGNLIGLRRFTPSQYLDSSIDLELGMLPGKPVQVVLELADAGDRAVSFEFDFL